MSNTHHTEAWREAVEKRAAKRAEEKEVQQTQRARDEALRPYLRPVQSTQDWVHYTRYQLGEAEKHLAQLQEKEQHAVDLEVVLVGALEDLEEANRRLGELRDAGLSDSAEFRVTEQLFVALVKVKNYAAADCENHKRVSPNSLHWAEESVVQKRHAVNDAEENFRQAERRLAEFVRGHQEETMLSSANG